MDKIKKYVNKAHDIFGQASIFEVYDVDDQAARDYLNRTYDNPDAELIDEYLKVISKLRKAIEDDS